MHEPRKGREIKLYGRNLIKRELHTRDFSRELGYQASQRI